MSRHLFDGRAQKPRLLALSALSLLFLLAAPAAFAGWTVINTNDNAVAGDLGAPRYTSNCGDPNVTDYFEIKNAWVVADGNGFYFRLEACGQPAAGSQTTSLRIGAGLDCNNDGDIEDGWVTGPDGDRKIIYWLNADQTWVYSGSNQQITSMPDGSYGERVGAFYDWYAPINTLPPDCRAGAFSVGLAFGTAQVSGLPVTRDESPIEPWRHSMDYGDADNPDPAASPPTCTLYPTRISCNGARHGTESALRLGALVDGDGGDKYGPNAEGDDLDGLADEDGVSPTGGANWTVGANGGSLTAQVTGGSGYLNCWIDWNRDNDWADSGEKVVDNSAAPVGPAVRTFAVPSGTTFPGAFIARCRLAPGSGQGSAVTGAVEFGEVEDHRWVFGATGNRPVAPEPVAASVVNTTDLRLTWTNSASNEGYLVLSSADPYFLPGDAGVTSTLDSGSPFDQPGVVGGIAANAFYAVQGQVTSSTPDLTSAPSNRVGLFEYELTRGG